MRKIAADILYAYKKEGAYINLSLNKAIENNQLKKEDKDLLTRIVYGTVQNELYLDYQIEPYLHNKIKLFDLMVIKMSIYQMLFLDRIPHYAIINEAVEIVKKKNAYRSKTVNAILRNFERNGKREIEAKDELERISIQYSTPLWLVKMLKAQYGDQMIKIVQSFFEVPLLTARVNTLKANKEELLSDRFKEGNLSQDSLIYKEGNIANSEEYKQGLVTVQDESSQLVARLLDPAQNSHVLDMCCAPGSKTSHLAMIMNNTGNIDAHDLYEHKIRLVQNQLDRLGVTNTSLHVGDSTKLSEVYPHESFDYILLDAPCSGLGVIGRKPEIKYQDNRNMDEIIAIQKNLLDNAYVLLKHGGSMVYSTCTLNRKENDKQIKAFVEKYKDMKVIKERVILPYEYHSDGFYMCKLVKDYGTDL